MIFPDTTGVLARTLLRHPLRTIARSVWLGGALLYAALDFAATVAFTKTAGKPQKRALWLQRNSRRVLRVIRMEWRTAGPIPIQGLLVCNHLSYLDILVIAAIRPATFVAKHEIKGWPVFGWFSRLGGTIFVEREKRSDIPISLAHISTALEAGALLVLFAEGTTSNGETVLPFKSSLLATVATTTCPKYAAYINYSLSDGDVVEEVYYWRDMTMPPHLLNLLGKRQVSAKIIFSPVTEPAANRKELARKLHAQVLRLKETWRPD